MYKRDRNKQSPEELLRTHYQMKNGNVAYIDRILPGRCNVHWEVNPAGIIVSYRYEPLVKGGCEW